MNIEFICQYIISKRSLALCSSLSEFHVAGLTQHQAQVHIFSHWQGFPIQAWHDVNHKSLTTLESGQIEPVPVHSMSHRHNSLEPLEYWGRFHFHLLICSLS